MTGREVTQELLDSHSFRLLMITFALVIALAIIGSLMVYFFHTTDDIFHEAMRIIGLSGTAGTGTQAVSDGIAKWRQIPTATNSSITPAITTGYKPPQQ